MQDFPISNFSSWFPLHLNPDFFSSYLYRKHLRALFFPSAGTIFEADMPAMPATDDFAVLDQSLTQRKSKVWAKVFNSVNFPFPLEQCNPNPISLYAYSEAVRHQVSNACNPYPSVHVPDDILRPLYFVRPS